MSVKHCYVPAYRLQRHGPWAGPVSILAFRSGIEFGRNLGIGTPAPFWNKHWVARVSYASRQLELRDMPSNHWERVYMFVTVCSNSQGSLVELFLSRKSIFLKKSSNIFLKIFLIENLEKSKISVPHLIWRFFLITTIWAIKLGGYKVGHFGSVLPRTCEQILGCGTQTRVCAP